MIHPSTSVRGAVRLALVGATLVFPTWWFATGILVTQPSVTDTEEPGTQRVPGSCLYDVYGWGGSHLTLESAGCESHGGSIG